MSPSSFRRQFSLPASGAVVLASGLRLSLLAGHLVMVTWHDFRFGFDGKPIHACNAPPLPGPKPSRVSQRYYIPMYQTTGSLPIE